MNEQEEFEFRRRFEQEKASAPAPTAGSDLGPVMRGQASNFMRTLANQELPADQRAKTETELATLIRQPEMAGVDVSALAPSRPAGMPQEAPVQRSGAPQTAAGMGGSPPQAPKPSEGVLRSDGSDPWFDRFRYGLAGVGVQGYLGAKNTLGYKLDPEEMNVLAQSKADVEHSGAVGKTANLVGNVGAGVAASMLAPAGILPASIGALGKYGPAAAQALKTAVASGAYEGVAEPAEDQDNIALSKTKQALKAAGYGVGAYGLGAGLVKAGTGMFKATKDAADLFAQGINPTLQQAAESWPGRFVGGLTSGFTKTKERQEQEMLDALTKRTSEGKVDLPGSTINQRIGALTDSIGQDIKDVYKGTLFPITTQVKDAMRNVVDNVSKNGAFDKEQDQVSKIVENIIPDRYTRYNISTLRDRLIDPLDEAINNASNSRVKQALSDVRDVVLNHHNAQLSQAQQDALAQIKPRAQDLERLKAATAGQGEQEGASINKLGTEFDRTAEGKASATNQEVIGPAARVFGKTARQDEARTALVNTMRIGGGAAAFLGSALTGMKAPLAMLYGLSAAGQTAKGARVLTGQTAPQLAAKEALESPQTSEMSMANVLRAVRDNMSAVGNAFTGPKLPPNAKYEDYIRAYDAAKDKDTKIRLGEEWTAQQSKGS